MNRQEKWSWVWSILVVGIFLVTMFVLAPPHFSANEYCQDQGYNESTDSYFNNNKFYFECDGTRQFVRKYAEYCYLNKWGLEECKREQKVFAHYGGFND